MALLANFLDFEQTPSFILYFTLLASLLWALMVVRTNGARKEKNIPPGSLGLPVIGETLQFLKARKTNKTKDWIQRKVSKYGPVFKTSLMGCPTVVLTGQEGNRFIFHNDYGNIFNKQTTRSVTRVFGRRSLRELAVEDHKRIRGAIFSFLKPEALHSYAGKMECIIKRHFADCWEGRDIIDVWPLMKKLTFDVACEMLFGLNDDQERQILSEEFAIAVKGLWSIPLDLPGSNFRKCLNARSNICRRLSALMEAKRKGIEGGIISPRQDLMSSLLSMRDENNKGLTEEEIIDNLIVVMIAGHDTTAVLLTHLVKVLAVNPDIYQNILQEQKDVLSEKSPNEPLRWEDVQKMKYTWKVAQETLRLTPPVFGGFRKTLRDVEYGGYTIPEGWQLYWVTSPTNMDGEVFSDPDKFDPRHFNTPIPPYTFVSFGAGPCICPGYDFAKMESVIFLCHLISKYKWSMMIPDEKITCDPLPVPAMGLPIKLQPLLN